MKRTIAGVLLSAYLGAGLFAGLSLQRAIPALNPIGVAWITTTWPNMIRCARVEALCDLTGPDWLAHHLFSFPKVVR